MNGAAKRTMPVRLGIRVLARLWPVHMRPPARALLVWLAKAALERALYGDERRAFGPPSLLCLFSVAG